MARTLAEKIATQVGPRVDGDTHPEVSVASQRGPIEGEIRNLAVTTSSVLHHVPDGNAANLGTPRWNGRFVRMQAVGGDVYIAFSSDGACTIDASAVSVQSSGVTVGSVTATRITGHATNEECWLIPNGETHEVPVPSDANVFALRGSAACNLLAYPSET